MRIAVARVLLVLAVCSLALSGQQQAAKGVLEGVVVRLGTGEPIAGAQVSAVPQNPNAAAMMAAGVAGGIIAGGGGLITTAPPPILTQPPLPPAPPAPPSPPQVTTTDREGKFSIAVDPGQYGIVVVANGYVRQQYGQRVLNAIGGGTVIELGSGQKTGNIAIPLTPTGTVRGRIVDDSGQPALAAPVQLLRRTFNAQGPTFQMVGSGIVDDRGEYRIFAVPPGRYYLYAGNAPGPLRLPGGGPVQTSGVSYAPTFYPNAKDIAQATLIDVQPAAEATYDLMLARQQTYRISGRVIDAATGQAPAAVTISRMYQTLTGGFGSSGSPRDYNPADGTFLLQNVLPGDWTIQAQIQQPSTGARGGPVDAETRVALAREQASRPTASAQVRVTNADVVDVMLVLTTGISAGGRVLLEGQSIESLPGLDRISLSLRPIVRGRIATTNTGSFPVTLPTAADGTFTIEALREGEYVAVAGGIPQGYHLKSVQYGGTDVLYKPFRFAPGSAAIFEVTLRQGTASLSGAVADATIRPAAGAWVALIPDDRHRTDLYRALPADNSGRFNMTNITPGNYKLFSWEIFEQGNQFDPEFLSRHETSARTVQLGPTTNASVELRLISSNP